MSIQHKALPHCSAHQMTVSEPVVCAGIGLHSGDLVQLCILPAPEHHGIVFQRTDVAGDAAFIPALYHHVSDTQLGTTIENGYGTKVSTIEHLMAALWGAGVDNALIQLDGAEVPIMDGSSEPFLFLLECAGVYAQDALRQYIMLDAPVEIEHESSHARIAPASELILDVEIAFSHGAIGAQRAVYDFSLTGFKRALSRARTFGFAKEVEYLQSIGLARGGSLQNAIVLNEHGVMNEEGLRFDDEFVRHKALDCIGDYFLAGHRILGKIVTHKPGHGINNKLMHALHTNRAKWRLVSLPELQAGKKQADIIPLRPHAGSMPRVAVMMADK